VQGAEDEVAGFRRFDGDGNRLQVTQLTTRMMSGSSRNAARRALLNDCVCTPTCAA
jgi:hypothetical protein